MPSGGEQVPQGAGYNIFWETLGYEASYPMDLSYSKDNGATFLPIASKVANNSGNYIWQAPDEIVDKAMIKVADSFDNTIYGVSANSFSISSSRGTDSSSVIPAEAGISEEEEAISKPPDDAHLKLYELLVMAKTRADGKKEDLKRFYNRGDIVMIRPAGFLWGASEKGAGFVIVRAYLTEKEAQDFMTPQNTIRGKETEIVRERRYRVDIDKKDILLEQVQAMEGLVGTGPIITKTAIVDKSTEK